MKHNDNQTTVQELKNAVKKFNDDREWAQFHTPQYLAMNLSVEASELLELFLWKNTQTVEHMIKNDPDYKQAIQDELADV